MQKKLAPPTLGGSGIVMIGGDWSGRDANDALPAAPVNGCSGGVRAAKMRRTGPDCRQ